MKILMITPYLPYPLLSGGQVRSYNLIRQLSKRHKITLFTFIRKEEERQNLSELLKYCQKVRVFKRRPAFSLFNIILSGISYYPFLMSLYWDPQVKKEIGLELENERYDLIHVETFYVMHLLPQTPLPVVLAEQNIEYQVYKKFSDQSNLFLRPFLYLDVLKMRIWEEFFWQKAKKIVVASVSDLRVIKKRVSGPPLALVANGVDLDYFKNLKKEKHANPIILFVGNFKWLQNRDAVSFLITKIWPKIKRIAPKVQLLIVGRDASESLKKTISRTGAILREDVLEIKEVYQRANVLLAPIRIGGGTKFKILEAMAAGVPVVTTKEGIEGLEVKNGREVLVGDSPGDLAEKVIEVLKNKDLRIDLIKKARAKVLRIYNWQTIGERLDDVYREVGSGKN